MTNLIGGLQIFYEAEKLRNRSKVDYERKLISPDKAAELVKSNSEIVFGPFAAYPTLIDDELAKRVYDLENTTIHCNNMAKESAIIRVASEESGVIFLDHFFSRITRKFQDRGLCTYVPENFGDSPRVFRNILRDRIDVAFVEVTQMDKNGYFNFGPAVAQTKAMCDAARTVVVEVNDSMPWVLGGYDEVIHISDVDYIVQNDKYKIQEMEIPKSTDVDEMIAQNVVGLIEQESTIQLGIGGLPNAVGRLLIEHEYENLGIHTEMFTESMMEMIEKGIVTCRKKTVNPNRAVFTFSLGTRRLYDFLDHNPMLAAFPVDYTNNPHIIARNRRMVAINSALRSDLQGQVSSESVGYHHISGTGGQHEIVRAVNGTLDGKSIICLKSTHRAEDGSLKSNVVPSFAPGEIVTVPRADIEYIATEYGMVNLRGKNVCERAKALISIAYPDFQNELEKKAREAGLIH